MNFGLSREQQAIHQRAIRLALFYKRAEWNLVDTLRQVEKTKTHKALGLSSLLKYATQVLDLTEPVALAFIAVARKAAAVPALAKALADEKIQISKAARIVSILTLDNADELIDIARTRSKRDVEFEVVRRNPKAVPPERVKPISEDMVTVTVTISKQGLAKWERAQSLLAQKTRRHVTLGGAAEYVFEKFVEREDPVLKAQKAVTKITFKNTQNIVRNVGSGCAEGSSNQGDGSICPGREKEARIPA